MYTAQLNALFIEFQNVVKRAYPSFVWNNRPQQIRGHIPVFSFHSVEYSDLEAKLKFLRDNGYSTITADECYNFIVKKQAIPDRSIMLTFDDGRISVWSIAYPLLKKYGFRATVFLVPDIVRKDEKVFPNLEDFWAKRCSQDELERLEEIKLPTISWREAEIMHRDGVIDFQSHTLNHTRIPIGSRIIGFVTPESIERYLFEFNIPSVEIDGGSVNLNSLLGSPVYENRPFVCQRPMFICDEELKKRCIGHVAENGGESFFNKKGWLRELQRVVIEYRKVASLKEGFETTAQQKKRIILNLRESRERIEEHLNGKRVLHLSYPWGQGSEISIESSRESGFVTNFWSTIPHKAKNEPGSDPFRIVRIKHDFIWRLPGEGRRSLADLFLIKFLRRTRGEIDY